MNEKFKFIKYIEVKNDMYLNGIAEIEVCVPIVLRYKHAKKKEGGDFFVAASYAVEENGAKRYLPAFEIDSRKMNEEIMSEIRRQIHGGGNFHREPISEAVQLELTKRAQDSRPSAGLPSVFDTTGEGMPF